MGTNAHLQLIWIWFSRNEFILTLGTVEWIEGKKERKKGRKKREVRRKGEENDEPSFLLCFFLVKCPLSFSSSVKLGI